MGKLREMLLNTTFKSKTLCLFRVVIVLFCRIAKLFSHFFPAHIWVFLIWRGKRWCHFCYYVLPLENCCALRLKSKPWFLTHFSFLWEDLHLLSRSAALPLLPRLHPCCCFDRLECHALQEEPDAFGALLQPGSAPHDAGDGSSPNGCRAVVWENAGRQCQQVCLHCALQQFGQKGPLLWLENAAFKPNPRDATSTKSGLSRNRRLQTGFLCTIR